MRISDWSSDVCSSDLADVEVELDRAGALVTVHDLLVRHRDAVVDHPEEVRLAGAHPRGDLDLHPRGQLAGEVAEAHRSVDLQGLSPVHADLREVERALPDDHPVAVSALLAPPLPPIGHAPPPPPPH